ncbi:MAG TPA: transketolase [Thermoanaerobaculia bacterium]|nr:transketolase [Thermoanaerobaculia bacterium]
MASDIANIANSASEVTPVERWADLKNIAHQLRHHVVHLATDSPGAHVGGSMSVIEILTVLFFDGVLNVDPSQPKKDGRDYLIFSKGHASAALYSALAERGFFPVEELKTYKQMGSRLAGHSLKSIPGVELATGSLGHGLGVGNGLALAGRYDNASYRTFVILGDGECQEGSVWEAAMAAAHYKLDNLVAIVDRNGVQEDGPTEQIMALEPFADKWRSFGWEVREVNGHNVEELSGALHAVPFAPGKPSLLIAKTVKGKGISFTENTNAWHYGRLSSEQREKALSDLGPRPVERSRK